MAANTTTQTQTQTPTPTESENENADADALAPIEARSVRALTECMIVYADDPETWSDEEVAVYSGPTRYIVNTDTESCSCRDYELRHPSGGCKHLRRYFYSVGELDIPAWANLDAVDPQLIREREKNGVDVPEREC